MNKKKVGYAAICIFCGRTEKDVEFHDEHVIPDSIGGRLVFKDTVCCQCNNEFGHAVDVEIIKLPDVIAAFEKLGLFQDRREKNLNNHYKITAKTGNIELVGKAWGSRFVFSPKSLADGSFITPEHDFSRDPDEFAALVKHIKRKRRGDLSERAIEDIFEKLRPVLEQAEPGDEIECPELALIFQKMSGLGVCRTLFCRRSYIPRRSASSTSPPTHMGHPFVSVDRSTPFLLPPSLQEWLPEDHLVRFILEVVDQLDLTPLEQAYAGRGSKAYHPGMLLALLFYGYATGVFSSRKLEAATYDSIAFRFISANTHPDHDTIATFRRRFLPQLEQFFTAILLVAAEMGFLKLGTVSLDGSNRLVLSRMKANASKHKALSYGHAETLEAQLQQEVDELLALAEATDREEEKAQIDIPEELQRRQERLAAIRTAKEKIEARAQERYQAEQAAYEAKLEARRANEEATGKKTGGKPPKQIPGEACYFGGANPLASLLRRNLS